MLKKSVSIQQHFEQFVGKHVWSGQVIVLRRISDYGYITAPLAFTTRWGYGVRILDLIPRRPHGGCGETEELN